MRLVVATAVACVLYGCASTPYQIGRKQNGDFLSYTTSDNGTITQIRTSVITAKSDLSTVQSTELAESLLDRSDVYCQDYLTGVSILNNGLTSGLDITALTLSSVVPVVTPTASKNIISAISAMATGSKTILTNNILGGKEYGLIHDAIINGRQDERKTIEAEIKGGYFKDWNADAILSHIQPYHMDCGIEFGLQYLRAAVTNQSKTGATPPSPVDTAISTAIKAKTASDRASDNVKDLAVATSDAASGLKASTDAAMIAVAAAPAQKAKAVADAKLADLDATTKLQVATSIRKSQESSKAAAEAWADASSKADLAAKAYLAAEAATTMSDEAEKETGQLKASTKSNKPSF